MANGKTPPQTANNEVEITLGLLNAVQENDSPTQRSMAKELGIALGLANAYLKRCVKKGHIKVRQIPKNRYAYYLTPQGFAEKSRLTAEYLSQSFNFFRLARNDCKELFSHAQAKGWRRVAFFGVSDLCEIATLCARDFPVTLAGIVDGQANRPNFAGLRVEGSLESLGTVDAIVITDLTHPQAAFEAAGLVISADRILTPGFLHISRREPKLEE